MRGRIAVCNGRRLGSRQVHACAIKREGQRDGCAYPFFRRNAQAKPHSFAGNSSQIQPHTRCLVMGASPASRKAAIEHTWHIGSGNAIAIIADNQLDTATFCACIPHRTFKADSLRTVFR